MPNRKSAILLVSAVLAAALAAGTWVALTHREEILTDGSGIEIPSSNATPRDILWQPPKAVNLDEIPSVAVAGSVSPAGDRFVFTAAGPNGDSDLFETIRTDDGSWSARHLTTASSPDQETTPSYSPDGRWLWFASDRPGGQGGYDLWRAPSTVDGWGKPEYVALDLVQTRGDEVSPSLSAGGKLLAFARRNSSTEPADLVVVALSDEGPSSEVAHQLNSASDDRTPAFSPAGDFLYFASDRPGGAGGQDLYRARLRGASFDDPTWLGEEVNSKFDETNPTIDTAGFRIRFRATRPEDGGYRETTAKEIYRSIRTTWPRFGIGNQLLMLLPWLLAALALVLLFAAFRQLAARENWQRRWGTLGLMARCALLSMGVHAVLALLLSLWQVENGLPLSEEGSEIKVALTTRASTNDIATQLHAPTLNTRQAPADDARPQSTLPAEANEQEITPVESAVSTISASFRDATVLPERRALPSPRKDEAGSPLQRPLPAASRVRETKPSSQVRQTIAMAGNQALPRTSEPSSVSMQPVNPEGARPVLGSTDEADTSIDFASTIDTTAPALTQTMQTMTMPTGARAALTEQNSQQQIAAEPSTRSGALPKSIEPRTVDLPLQNVKASAFTEGLPDVSIQPDSDIVSSVAPQLSSAFGFTERDMPTAMQARPEQQMPTNIPMSSGAPAIALAPAGSRMMFIDPQDMARRSLAGTLSKAAPSASTSRSTALPRATELAHGLLPVTAKSDDVTAVLSSALTVIDMSPAPIAGRHTQSIRTEVLNPTAPPLVENLNDGAASYEQTGLILPLVVAMNNLPELPVAPVVPAISGVVLDAITDQPIADALVRLDGEADTLRETQSDFAGRFALTPADLPDFAVLTVSAKGYATKASNISKTSISDGAWIEFRLQPISKFDIALDDDPRVHHLGNDEFTGAINSQFQVRSQGTIYSATVVLDRSQLAASVVRAEFRALVRGAQNQNPITVNGQRLSTAMTNSPADGSFGVFTAPIPLRLLREGENVIEVRAVDRQGTDIDDFEFVNLRLLLIRQQRPQSTRF